MWRALFDEGLELVRELITEIRALRAELARQRQEAGR
jgi:hypothetical protein